MLGAIGLGAGLVARVVYEADGEMIVDGDHPDTGGLARGTILLLLVGGNRSLDAEFPT